MIKITTVMTKAEPLARILNKEVANCSVLYMKLHNFHWFVKGEGFFELHSKFEELYTDMGLHLDTIAERILAIGEQPVATLKEILSTSSIKEATGNETTMQMVQQITKDFEMMCNELSVGIEAAEEVKDQPSADMLIGIRSSLEKQVWMFKAYQSK